MNVNCSTHWYCNYSLNEIICLSSIDSFKIRVCRGLADVGPNTSFHMADCFRMVLLAHVYIQEYIISVKTITATRIGQISRMNDSDTSEANSAKNRPQVRQAKSQTWRLRPKTHSANVRKHSGNIVCRRE